MSAVRLRDFDNSWYHPGRPRWQQILWFFLGLPLLRSSWIPSSSFRVRLLRLFGSTLGSGVVIKPGVRVKYPWHLRAGNHCWIGEDAWIDNLAAVTLGSDVCLSQRVYLCTGNHDWSDPAFALRPGEIRIDDGAWIGAGAIVAPGTHVEEGAVAAAGSVVSRRLPRWEIHGGNPAVFLKKRTLRSSLSDSQPEIDFAMSETGASR